MVNKPTPPRVALSINIEAPVLYMPKNSRSRNAIVFDLGRISVNNQFEVVSSPTSTADSTSSPLLMDQMAVRLEDLRMSACVK